MLLNVLQITNPLLSPQISQTSGGDFFALLLPNLVSLALLIAGVVFLAIMIVGGITWITSGGDKQAIESARSRITNALIGIVIVLSIFAIVKIIEIFFGISLLAFDLKKLKL